ncbi:MAG: (2Fe-2S)-binding protein [Thermoleophilia bacterium]
MDGTSEVRLSVNGMSHTLAVGAPPAEVHPSDTLAHTLRETLGLTGTKVSCDHGACGSCTVLVDGQAMLSCMMLTAECDGRSVVTVEGLADPETGELHPLQQSFVDHTAFQCGFCTPGILMSAKALLDANSAPSLEEVQDALSGNHCRCITHYHVLEAVQDAAARMRGAAPGAVDLAQDPTRAVAQPTPGAAGRTR